MDSLVCTSITESFDDFNIMINEQIFQDIIKYESIRKNTAITAYTKRLIEALCFYIEQEKVDFEFHYAGFKFTTDPLKICLDHMKSNYINEFNNNANQQSSTFTEKTLVRNAARFCQKALDFVFIFLVYEIFGISFVNKDINHIANLLLRVENDPNQKIDCVSILKRVLIEKDDIFYKHVNENSKKVIDLAYNKTSQGFTTMAHHGWLLKEEIILHPLLVKAASIVNPLQRKDETISPVVSNSSENKETLTKPSIKTVAVKSIHILDKKKLKVSIL